MSHFDPYETWLGIAADRRPPTPCDLLDLAISETDPDKIEQAAVRRMDKIRKQLTGPRRELAQRLLAELASAHRALVDPNRLAQDPPKVTADNACSTEHLTGQERHEEAGATRSLGPTEKTLPEIIGLARRCTNAQTGSASAALSA